MIFDLKGVFVGKEYFRINHLLLSTFNLTWCCILFGKSVDLRLTLKEFLSRCLEQFTTYIWTFVLLAKMNSYLKQKIEEIGIEIDPQKIISQNLCNINKHFLQFPFKIDLNRVDRPTCDKTIYHKNLSYFPPRYSNTHLGNTLWYTIHLLEFAWIHLLMRFLLNPMKMCQKRIII
jgi:hypothetical protein